jgi:hypothetical protein
VLNRLAAEFLVLRTVERYIVPACGASFFPHKYIGLSTTGLYGKQLVPESEVNPEGHVPTLRMVMRDDGL